MTLPYDQIPPERRTLGDFTGRLDGHNGVLGVALAQWVARDDSKAEPEVRQAASTAMDAIDAMIAELHQLRARLVSEIRKSDDMAAARTDNLLGPAPSCPRCGTGRPDVAQTEPGCWQCTACSHEWEGRRRP